MKYKKNQLSWGRMLNMGKGPAQESVGQLAYGTSKAASEAATRAIAHELTEHTRKALTSGTLDAVLAQDSAHEVRSAIRVLKAVLDDAPIIESQERIRIEIFVRDNLP